MILDGMQQCGHILLWFFKLSHQGPCCDRMAGRSSDPLIFRARGLQACEIQGNGQVPATCRQLSKNIHILAIGCLGDPEL